MPRNTRESIRINNSRDAGVWQCPKCGHWNDYWSTFRANRKGLDCKQQEGLSSLNGCGKRTQVWYRDAWGREYWMVMVEEGLKYRGEAIRRARELNELAPKADDDDAKLKGWAE